MPARVIRHQQEAGPVRVPLFSLIVADAVCYARAAVIFSRGGVWNGGFLTACALEGVTSSQMLH